MRDARYLRGQANLCLQIAREMSDRKAAEKLRAEAVLFDAEAAEIEGRSLATSPTFAKDK